MVVASIYCIVIIYIPSVEEQNSKILPEPKRCVTTQVTWPDIHHDRLRMVLMKETMMALRITMTAMMTRLQVERNITSVPGDGKCAWSSCMEWCLTKGAPSCSKVAKRQNYKI